MRKQANVENIERAIEGLTREEQLRIVEKIARQLRRVPAASVKELDWGKFYGLGKGLWNEDAQEYISRSREDRE
jgi:hypothetical protein